MPRERILVYRVQHKRSGIGPYNNYAYGNSPADEYFERSHNGSSTHPTPWADFPIIDTSMLLDGTRKSTSDVKYCFASLKQYRRWFNKTERNILDTRGYHLVCLSVPKNRVGIQDCQARFVPTKSVKKIAEFSCQIPKNVRSLVHQ